MPIKNNERLLMFLRKGIDNPDCYVPVGTSMKGIYRISENKTNR